MKLDAPLTGERIILRNYVRTDLPFLTEMWLDEKNGKYLSDPTKEFVNDVYQKALDHLENSTDGYYLVAELQDSGEPVGSAGIFPTGEGVYDIGYCVHQSKWQQGFGSEMVALLLEWLRCHGAEKVMAEVAIENLPSKRLLQKFGFTVEKTSSFKKYNMDVSFDSVLYKKELFSERAGR